MGCHRQWVRASLLEQHGGAEGMQGLGLEQELGCQMPCLVPGLLVLEGNTALQKTTEQREEEQILKISFIDT